MENLLNSKYRNFYIFFNIIISYFLLTSQIGLDFSYVDLISYIFINFYYLIVFCFGYLTKIMFVDNNLE